jgi:hypothetical protein
MSKGEKSISKIAKQSNVKIIEPKNNFITPEVSPLLSWWYASIIIITATGRIEKLKRVTIK